MDVLATLFELVRDLAVLAAAVGIAKWAWDRHRQAPGLRDSEARAALDSERRAADMRQWGARIEALATDIQSRLDEAGVRERDAERRAGLKVQIHHLLQSTRDPFLTFGEIRDALPSGIATHLVARADCQAIAPERSPTVSGVQSSRDPSGPAVSEPAAKVDPGVTAATDESLGQSIWQPLGGRAIATDPEAEAALRRALIELIAGGAVAQLDHDRYFIATNFEADDNA